MIETITNFDFSILDWIQANLRCELLDKIMPVLSMLGEWGIFWIILGLILLIFRKTRRCGVLMLISMAVVFLIGDQVIKPLVGRVRPCNIRLDLDIPVDRPSSNSFPSGHAGIAFTATTMIFMHHKGWGIAALVLSLLIAFSRLYNYVHYPTDVLAGIAFGILVAIVVYFIAKKVKPSNPIKDRKNGKHYSA